MAKSKRSRPEPRRCLGATRFGQDRSSFFYLRSMNPFEWSRIDADQSKIFGWSLFALRPLESSQLDLPQNSLQECRANALKCYRIAQEAVDMDVRQALFDLVIQWRELAARIERLNGQKPLQADSVRRSATFH